MKISMIGPSYPFRGGISHYTTLLFRELKKSHSVQFISFKRQYPAFLYPGKSDIDESKSKIKEEGAERLLDSVNPLSWLKTARKVVKFHPQILIFPWWVSFWTPQFLFISLFVKFFSKTKIMFICHNVIEHESSFFDKICTSLVLRRGNHFIVHSGEDYNNLKKIIAEKSIIKAFHPLYNEFSGKHFDKNRSRKKLAVCGKILLFFGFVRPYKGLMTALNALPFVIKKYPDTKLIVAGEFWQDKNDYIDKIDELGIIDNVVMHDNYIPNEETGIYFTASDLVLLPYISATGSGIVQLAYSFNKPVIASKVGALAEVVVDNSTGFLVEEGNSEELAEAIIKFFHLKKADEFSTNIEKEKEKYSWSAFAEIITSLEAKNYD